MQAGVHGEEQTPAGPAEGAEDGDRVSEAGGAAAAAGRRLHPAPRGPRLQPGAGLPTSEQRTYLHFRLHSSVINITNIY